MNPVLDDDDAPFLVIVRGDGLYSVWPADHDIPEGHRAVGVRGSEAECHAFIRDQTELFVVVVNQEEQYSIWPVGKGLPPGWRAAGKRGTKAECLAHISEVWTDLRPLSLRTPGS